MTTSIDDRVFLEHAAVTFSALGAVLYREPDEASVGELLESGFFEDIPFAGDNAQVREGIALLGQWASGVREEDFAGAVVGLRCEWLRLFVGIHVPQAPAWATFYFEKDPLIFGRKTLEVRQWYARYGLQIERKHKEPDDHLGLMLQFLATVITQEADALRSGDQDAAACLRADEQQFVASALQPWVGRWQELVAAGCKEDGGTFYPGLALLIVGALQVFSQRFSKARA